MLLFFLPLRFRPIKFKVLSSLFAGRNEKLYTAHWLLSTEDWPLYTE